MKLKKARQDRYYIESKDKVDKVYCNINDLRDLVEQIEEVLELESQEGMLQGIDPYAGKVVGIDPMKCITFNNIEKVNFIK